MKPKAKPSAKPAAKSRALPTTEKNNTTRSGVPAAESPIAPSIHVPPGIDERTTTTELEATTAAAGYVAPMDPQVEFQNMVADRAQ